MFNNIHIILVNPCKGVNVGATCRAMNGFGLSKLRIVSKRKPPIHTTLSATATTTSHALHILNQCSTYETLESAVQDLNYVVGTTRRNRRVKLPQLETEEIKEKIISVDESFQIGILFGNEDNGLDHTDFNYCNSIFSIPSEASLNLSHAVSTVCYEIYKQKQELVAEAKKDLGLEIRKDGSHSNDNVTIGEIIEFEKKTKSLLEKIKWQEGAYPIEYTVDRFHAVLMKIGLKKKEFNLILQMIKRVNETLGDEGKK